MPSRLALIAVLLLGVCACSHNPDDAFVRNVRALRPSVVLLTMNVPPEHKGDKYDQAYASGTIVASGAWGSDILTVEHAVEGAWNMSATMHNHERAKAKVIASDKALDVAIVRTTAAKLPVAPLGDSNALQDQVGREVGLLGFPIPDEFADDDLGLATSLTTGRLSSVRKGALEVTLQIVPGESGGPVFLSDSGEIVGVAESRFDDERSIGFALPIDDARRFLHQFDAAHGF
ncbi:MAG TPA: trypsin-like peptidase domain-containing protein [Candidatus Baltobacteraceae bacterium]|jgi:S1-C subfamily serine protease|nr:trypsin-like peptidase domain-containing protein [Candidatus Baltobacteraceae bacterium]